MVRKIAANAEFDMMMGKTAEESLYNEREVFEDLMDPSKLQLSKEQANRAIKAFREQEPENKEWLEADPEKLIAEFNSDKLRKDKSWIMNSPYLIGELYKSYNKGRINMEQFNSMRDLLNIQEELEAQGRRSAMDEFAKIPSLVLDEDKRRLSPEEREIFNFYNKELLPAYDKAYAPANFKKQNSAQLAMTCYLKKVAATAVGLVRKTAAPDPRRLKRLLMLLGGAAGAGGVAAGVNSARPGMVGDYWSDLYNETMNAPAVAETPVTSVQTPVAPAQVQTPQAGVETFDPETFDIGPITSEEQAKIVDEQLAANSADADRLLGEYAGSAIEVARQRAKAWRDEQYNRAIASYGGDVNNVPYGIFQDIDDQYQQRIDAGTRKYQPIQATPPEGMGANSGIFSGDY